MKNGVVVLNGPEAPPEGTDVSIRVLKAASPRDGGAPERAPTLRERLKSVIGKAKGMPPDASVNLDHYLYGAPKRK